MGGGTGSESEHQRRPVIADAGRATILRKLEERGDDLPGCVVSVPRDGLEDDVLGTDLVPARKRIREAVREEKEQIMLRVPGKALLMIGVRAGESDGRIGRRQSVVRAVLVDGERVDGREHNGEASAPPTKTPDRLILTCDDPGVQIKTPFWGDVVGDEFSVYGTVQHPELWNYTLSVGFVGEVATVTTIPDTWILVREPPHNQSIPEPSLEDTLLTEHPVNLSGQPAGFYVIRLRVTLRSGKQLQPCDIVVRH